MKNKKSKKKGFTLVELLAVIIILAIVVGITIPAILTTVDSARTKAFKSAADTVADWVDRQYAIQASGVEGYGVAELDDAYKAVCMRDCTSDDYTAASDNPNNCHCDNRVVYLTDAFIEAAGLKVSNIDTRGYTGTSATALYHYTIRTQTYNNIRYAMKTTNTDASVSGNRLSLTSSSGIYDGTRVYINPETGRSCVTLVSKEDSGDYPQKRIICGGTCSTTTTRANYCKEKDKA